MKGYVGKTGENDDNETSKEGTLKRRTVLASTAGMAGTAIGVGVLSGTVAAWERLDIDFKGCSEVWMIVGDDLHYSNPDPAVAHVIVATADGGTDCRPVDFTEENATRIPGRYGDAPVVKYVAGVDEKILGVIKYNYVNETGDGRFSKPSCLMVNEHTCAQTPNTPDVYSADCVQAAYDGHWNGSYWDDDCAADSIVDGTGPANGGDTGGFKNGSKDRSTGSGRGANRRNDR